MVGRADPDPELDWGGGAMRIQKVTPGAGPGPKGQGESFTGDSSLLNQNAGQVNIESSDTVTRFCGAEKPRPVGTCTWQEALEEIKNQIHKALIEQARSIRA